MKMTDIADLRERMSRIEANQEAHGEILSAIRADQKEHGNRLRDVEIRSASYGMVAGGAISLVFGMISEKLKGHF